MKFRLPLATAAAVVALAPAAHAATLASVARPVTVSTFDDTIAYSAYDHGAFQLMIGGTSAGVATSRRAFDVDLGIGTDRSAVAVYSRSGKLYEYDIVAKREKALGIKGTQPTISGSHLAYVRGRALYLDGKVVARGAVRDPELSARRLAYVKTIGRIELLVVQTLHGPAKPIYQARSGGLNQADIVQPTFDAAGRQLFFARRNLGSGSGNRYVRYDVASRKLSYAMGTDRLFSLGWIDDAAGFAIVQTGADDDASDPGSGVTVETTGALRFDARP